MGRLDASRNCEIPRLQFRNRGWCCSILFAPCHCAKVVNQKVFDWKKIPNSFPLKEKETRVLYHYYKSRTNAAEISKKTKIPQKTIQNYHKPITDLSTRLFDVLFKEGAPTAGRYWREMGMFVNKNG